MATYGSALVPADALGVVHPVAGPEARIVSLVPSITELVWELGLGGQLVGRTRFCIHPQEMRETVDNVGGTKQIKLDRLLRLRPTHVLLNIEENTREIARQLHGVVAHHVVTHPKRVLDNPYLYRLIGRIFGKGEEAERMCGAFDEALAKAREVRGFLPERRVIYLIWKRPWMAVSPATYIASMLRVAGWKTLPPHADPPYPVIDLGRWVPEADLILLSSEPYRFRERHVTELEQSYRFLAGRVRLIDGEMTSWYGPRAIAGLAYLTDYARQAYDDS